MTSSRSEGQELSEPSQGMKIATAKRMGPVGMKQKRAIIGVLIIVACSVVLVVLLLSPVCGFMCPALRQMKEGRKYMDSLTDAEVQQWVDRTKTYLAAYDPKAVPIGSTSVPSDLQKLRILRIDVLANEVRYVWMGGYDHTFLAVGRADDGTFALTANYDDKHSRVVWHKADKNAGLP